MIGCGGREVTSLELSTKHFLFRVPWEPCMMSVASIQGFFSGV